MSVDAKFAIIQFRIIFSSSTSFVVFVVWFGAELTDIPTWHAMLLVAWHIVHNRLRLFGWRKALHRGRDTISHIGRHDTQWPGHGTSWWCSGFRIRFDLIPFWKRLFWISVLCRAVTVMWCFGRFVYVFVCERCMPRAIRWNWISLY